MMRLARRAARAGLTAAAHVIVTVSRWRERRRTQQFLDHSVWSMLDAIDREGEPLEPWQIHLLDDVLTSDETRYFLAGAGTHEPTVDPDQTIPGFDFAEPLPAGCWADIWRDDALDYQPCNRPPESDVGLCARHLDDLARIRDEEHVR